jgi:hypothetical protein
MMELTALVDTIITDFKESRVQEKDGDYFFFYGSEEKFPFATIVTSDHEYDHVSNLDRGGLFRLNIGIDKSTFATMFGSIPAKVGLGGYLDSGIDFTEKNKLFPHPVYGTMYWVSIINPEKETYAQLKALLSLSYEKAVGRQREA